MSDASTTYDIRLRWTVEHAQQTEALLKRIADNTDNLAKSAKGARQQAAGLGDQFKMMAALAGGALGLKAGKALLFDFNASLEKTRIGMSAMLQMNIGGTWDEARGRAKGLVSDFQQIAKASVGTTEDFTNFNAAIMASVLGANNGLATTADRIQQLKRITAGGVVASTVLGERPELATLDIQQWLAGTLAVKDRFAQKLLAPMGVSHLQVNKMSQPKRLELLEKALTSPAIKNATKDYEQSWEGVSSTMEDTVKMTLGQVGLPIFKAITAEVRSWNQWIERNPAAIANFATEFSNALKSGFGLVKEALGLVWRNRDILMTLAKAVLIGKGAGLVGGLLASPFAAMAKFGETLGGINKPMADLGGGLSGLAGKVSSVATAFGAIYAAGTLVADLLLDRQERQIAARAENAPTLARQQVLDYNTKGLREEAAGLIRFKGYTPQAAEAQARNRVLEQLQTGGVLGKNGQINAGRVGDILGVDPGRVKMAMEYLAKNGTGNLSQRDMQDETTRFLVNLQKMLAEDRDMAGKRNQAFLDRMVLINTVSGWAQNTFLPIATQALIAAQNKTANDSMAAPKKRAGDTNVKVTINKVLSDDPDRFVLGLMSMVDDAIRNPSTVRGAIRR